MQTIIQSKLAWWHDAYSDENLAGLFRVWDKVDDITKWAAEDLCMHTGYLIALGAENLMPSYWTMSIGGRVALAAGSVTIEGLKKLQHSLKNVLTMIPQPPIPQDVSPEEKLLFYLRNHIMCSNDKSELLWLRLNNWATGIAIRKSSNCEPIGGTARRLASKLGVNVTTSDDPGAQYLQLLSLLEQVEAETDALFAEPTISLWLQEGFEKEIKESELFQSIIQAGAVELPSPFRGG